MQEKLQDHTNKLDEAKKMNEKRIQEVNSASETAKEKAEQKTKQAEDIEHKDNVKSISQEADGQSAVQKDSTDKLVEEFNSDEILRGGAHQAFASLTQKEVGK